MTPRATYRLQFRPGFGFADGARLAPYLARLGVSHLYSSPIQTARRGSTHGYDVVDHATINPELGGRDGFVEMAKALKAQGIGIILDIVPNHMFVGDGSNPWWQDLLECGEQSRFARYFDIDWDPPDTRLRGKVLLPFLARSYWETLRSGELTLRADQASRKLVFTYHGHRFPLRREDYADVLRGAPPHLADLAALNQPDRLHALLKRQNYVLAWWQSAGDRINWRRFFDFSELAGLRVEADEVFEAVHALPFDLFAAGLVDGFRIDHIDGLADPAQYLSRVRARLAERQRARPPVAATGPAYIVVEKILSHDETLCRDWAVDGTTGYDFLGEVGGLLHDPDGEAGLTSLWRRLSHRSEDFERTRRAARLSALDAFTAQLDAAVRAFWKASRVLPAFHDLSESTLSRALRTLISNLGVYRTYLTGGTVASLPRHLERAADRAKSAATPFECDAIELLLTVLAGNPAADPSQSVEAVRRFNQLASVVAAKGVEDTAYYRYNVLISRNEVGSDPTQFSVSSSAFHASCTRRQDSFPHTMIATSTHDHKRGGDARARLAVLSEIPSRWAAVVDEWFQLTDGVRPRLVERFECYDLFQTLVGAWPLELMLDDLPGLERFRERILAWRTKSLREARLRTSWTAIDAAYEDAHTQFVSAVLDPHRCRFLASFRDFVRDIAPAGAANALAQTVLHLTTPGVPDTYQGTEFWDFSLVDPDNRRDVDFPRRQRSLDHDAPPSRLAESWRDGRIKQSLTARLLAHRASDPELYAKGSYRPIEIGGSRSRNAVAFARCQKGRSLVVGVARCVADALVGGEAIAPFARWWEDTRLFASLEIGQTVRDVLQPEKTIERADFTLVSARMSDLPVFVLYMES